MAHIVLLLDHKANGRMLQTELGSHHRVELLEREAELKGAYDLCLLDGPALERASPLIQAAKEAQHPVFLPFLLITTRHGAGPQTHHLWKHVDECVALPVEKAELQARIGVLLRARQQSVELQRRNRDLEALTQALGHDLRAPARIAGRFTDALLENEKEPLGETNRRFATHVRSAITDMEAIISSLLELCKLGRQEVRLRPVSAKMVIDSCLHSLSADLYGAEIQVRDELPVVLADNTLLKMALTNLIANAAKFVAPGERPEITIYGEQAGEFGRVYVADRGVGIDPQDQARIFEPFVRLYGEEDYPGVGLGLPTVQRALELMGGQVGVTSAQQAGSTFWIELPLARDEG